MLWSSWHANEGARVFVTGISDLTFQCQACRPVTLQVLPTSATNLSRV